MIGFHNFIKAKTLADLTPAARSKYRGKIANLREARKRGARDFVRGVSVYSVPYSDLSKAQAWELGFREAMNSK